MNTQIETKLRRIERLSILLRGACTGLLIAIAIGAVAATVAVSAGRGTSVSYFDQSIPLADLTWPGRILLMGVCLLTGAVMAKALFHLRRLADNYSRREIFTAGSARQIRQFGISCVLWGVLKIVWAFLPMLLLTHPPGAVAISADSLVIGAVIVVISWFTEMATLLREENELTV